MKKTVLILFLVTLFFGGLNAQRSGLIRHYRPPSYGGPGFSLKDLFGYGTLSGSIPGTIYISMSVGPSFLNGDLDGPDSKTIGLGQNNMASIGLLHILPGNYGYKLSYMYGTYLGSDIGSIKNNNRGYKSSTKLSEISLRGEYFLIGGPYAENPISHSLYVFGGFGVILSNSLSTGEPAQKAEIYKQLATTPVFPVGFGYQYEVSENFLIGAEFGEHYAIGDYVDGFKPILGNKANDVLTHFALTFTLKLYNGKSY